MKKRKQMEEIEKLILLRKYSENFSVKTMYSQELKTSDLEQFISQSCKEKLVKLIVVYETSSVSKKKITLFKGLCDLDVFEKRYLQLLLKGHRLLLPHEKLDEESKKCILSHYQEENLPLLSPNDPMAILYDFKTGDIVKISRARGPYFRLVKEA